LRCVALRCVALRCVALRCVALRCVAIVSQKNIFVNPFLVKISSKSRQFDLCDYAQVGMVLHCDFQQSMRLFPCDIL